ncbi:MAG: DEAD/DEAH box helicase [Tetrasphaera jenkinsii]|jgi:ATP-dependent RNA helicase HelY|nr:DEAD/DEAH box helicase [Tetrasphaera jenkinsii]
MSELSRFVASLDFPLDVFQEQACRAVEAGQGVLVAAPTGAGKTVVGEFAVHLALARGQKAFYTTPIKALSNQKYADLVRRHGAANVGLLTGDSSVNGEAPVVVMTTEVLRNMVYAGSATLGGLAFVVMDEVHYLADRFRGAVWEEVIIHLPPSVQIVSLSATVSNAEEFGEWLGEVRGNHEVVVSEHRPVPLWQHMMVGKRMFDLFADSTAGPRTDGGLPRLNPYLTDAIRQAEQRSYAADSARRGARGRGGDQDRRRRPNAPPAGAAISHATRTEVVQALDHDGLLPAITFIFSRVGCEGAVQQLLSSGVRLIDDAAGERNRRLVEERTAGLADEDLGVLGYWDFVEGLARGFAAHHAGMLPTFREIVEELFTAGAIRAVFATETLALGINMPARTVVLEKLVKFNGESHVDLSAAEYTQLTGRAGRRGIDIEGHALVLWRRGLDPVHVAGLASTRTFPLRSSFRPSYNMAVNLVAQVGRARAAAILQTSFAQFQADRSVVGLVRARQDHTEAMTGYAEAMTCHLGDFREYAALRHELGRLEKDGAKARSAARKAEALVSVESLRIGDIIRIPTGRRAGFAVVLTPARHFRGATTLPIVLTEDKHVHTMSAGDVYGPVSALATMPVPKQFNAKSPKARRDLATTLRIKAPTRPRSVEAERDAVAALDPRIADLKRRMKAHPCHACPEREEHARWSDRWWRLNRERAAVTRQVEGRTNTVARTFERICGLLTDIGYLKPDGQTLTEDGERLRRIYSDRDLLIAECLRAGVWSHLDQAELAAVVSMLVHEPRFEEPADGIRQPTSDVAEAGTQMLRIWSELEDRERAVGLPLTAPPDAGLAWAMHRWASGQRLDAVLRGGDLAAGDFVRRCKQVVDLLDQIADAAPEPHLRTSARRAVDAVLRGVVASDRLD